MNNPWHDLSPGEQVPKQFSAVIEIPLGSSVKYEDYKRLERKRVEVDAIQPAAKAYPAIEHARAAYHRKPHADDHRA